MTVTNQSLIEMLRERWWRKVKEHQLEKTEIVIKARPLTPTEAIGKPARKDYPLLKGKEVMIEADIKGCKGQAFTDEPLNFTGKLNSIYTLPLKNNGNRALLVATINATYNLLGLVQNTRHCKDNGPEECGKELAKYLVEKHGKNIRVGMIGYQPAIVYHLSKSFTKFRVSDMDPENIGKKRNSIVIETYLNNDDIIEWSDIILATGTTIINNTINHILMKAYGKEIYFYGVTIAAAAYEFKLNRLCFKSLS